MKGKICLEILAIFDLNNPQIWVYFLPLKLVKWRSCLYIAQVYSSHSINVSSLIQFSRSVVSDSFRPHGLQHARPPCPSPTPEFTQTHVHRVGDAIQSSLPLLSPSPPAFNLSQHQCLFQWVISSHQVAKVLEFQLQHQISLVTSNIR